MIYHTFVGVQHLLQASSISVGPVDVISETPVDLVDLGIICNIIDPGAVASNGLHFRLGVNLQTVVTTKVYGRFNI